MKYKTLHDIFLNGSFFCPSCQRFCEATDNFHGMQVSKCCETVPAWCPPIPGYIESEFAVDGRNIKTPITP